jgi:hypothetical protein
MKKNLNLNGTSGVNYDLDKIKENSRLNPAIDLVVQVHEYDPTDPQSTANPKNLQVGQIWIVKKKENK